MTYNWDDILIVGDSFCSYRDTNDSWPQIVTCALTGSKFDSNREPRGKGFAGGAWWSYRKVLLKELEIKVPKVLIIFHTDPYRIPNDKDYSLNYVTVENRILTIDNEKHPMPVNVANAALLYYQELYSNEFAHWAVKRWFLELDDICKKYKIEKVIHLYCFDGDYAEHTFETGVTISTPLSSYTEKPKKILFKFNSKIINHFSVKGNKLFAESMIDLVNNYPGIVRLNKKMVNYGTS